MTATTPQPGAAHPADRPGELRARLSALLQESDSHRPLDSLESVVVRGFFAKRVPEGEVPGLSDAPTTIEGWVTWAVRHSSGS